MIIKCKCGCQLTKDLYPTKKFILAEVLEGYYENENRYIYKPAKGSYVVEKGRKDKYFSVGRDDCVALPEYKSGYGCCDFYGYIECPNCKQVVCSASLDCYCDVKCVDFYKDKVVRHYKK